MKNLGFIFLTLALIPTANVFAKGGRDGGSQSGSQGFQNSCGLVMTFHTQFSCRLKQFTSHPADQIQVNLENCQQTMPYIPTKANFAGTIESGYCQVPNLNSATIVPRMGDTGPNNNGFAALERIQNLFQSSQAGDSVTVNVAYLQTSFSCKDISAYAELTTVNGHSTSLTTYGCDGLGPFGGLGWAHIMPTP